VKQLVSFRFGRKKVLPSKHVTVGNGVGDFGGELTRSEGPVFETFRVAGEVLSSTDNAASPQLAIWKAIIYWSGKIEFVSLLPRSVSGRLSTADLQRHLFLNVGEVSMRPRPMSAVVALPPTVPHRCIIGREEAWRQRATVKRKKRRRMQLPVFGFGFWKHSRALQTLEVPKSWLAAR
jgi:hypothetical protein